MDRRSTQIFLQRRHMHGQETHEKPLDITKCQENESQNYNEYPFTLVRRAIIKKPANNKCWRRYGESETLLRCWWEGKLIQPLWRTVWRFFKKLKTELLYDPEIPLLGIYLDKNNQKSCMHPSVHCNIVYNSQEMEATQMSIDKEIKKMQYIHTMEYCSVIKRSDYFTIAVKCHT